MNNFEVINKNWQNASFRHVLINCGIAQNKDDKEHLCGVHILRHTFASMLFENGCDVKVVSELLGHSDTKITENIYIHLLQKQYRILINTVTEKTAGFLRRFFVIAYTSSQCENTTQKTCTMNSRNSLPESFVLFAIGEMIMTMSSKIRAIPNEHARNSINSSKKSLFLFFIFYITPY